MRRRAFVFFVVLLGSFSPVALQAAAPAHLWSQKYGDASFQVAYGVDTDAAGNIVVVGTFQGTVNFGGANLTSLGANDIFVVKFNSAGVHQWSQRFGDASDQFAMAVVVDGAGNIDVSGWYNGTLNFGGGNLVSSGEDVFVVQFNPAGAHNWSKRFGDNSAQRANWLATDSANNVVVTGFFNGTINFGGSNLSNPGSPYDVFLAKFNSSGTHQWSKKFGDSANGQYGISVTTDGSQNVILTGWNEGTINFGGSDLVTSGGDDVYLAKFDAAGNHVWSHQYGDATSFQDGRGVVADAAGNIYAMGDFAGTINFGGSALTTSGSTDTFVAKFNAAGVHQWSKGFGDANAQYFLGIAIDAAGNVALTGQYSGTIDFGGGDLVSTGSNMYIASLSPSGAHRWSARYGGLMNPNGLAFDASNNCISAGSMSGTANFGGSALTSSGTDVYVAKFDGRTANPQIINITDVPNDQGRKVKIRFVGSGSDVAGATPYVQQYEAFRRSSPTPGLASSSLQNAPDPKAFHGWSFVGSVPAHAESDYEMEAPTLADSTEALGLYNSAFFIRAATTTPSAYFDSAPDSGYSVDNLAPGIPGGFAFSGGQLTWDDPNDADFDFFTIYGANANSFASATLIDYVVTPALDVSASPYAYYFATATDFAGNEGKPAIVNTLSGLSGTPTGYVLSVSAYPNPFNPQTTIRYTLASRDHVELAVYDARGALVRTLLDGDKPAGAYTLRWDGRSNRGEAVSSGVYFARLDAGGATRSYKLVLLK